MADGILKVGTITTSSGSGTITIGQSGETINVSGTTGTGFGKILQVVSTLWSGGSSGTTSSTYAEVSSSLSRTITPSSTSSKIFVTCTGGFSYVPDGNRLSCNMYYKVGSGSYGEVGNTSYMIGASGSSGIASAPHSYSFLHSPSSTSELTYSLFQRRNSGSDTVYATTTNGVTLGMVLTCMEIAG